MGLPNKADHILLSLCAGEQRREVFAVPENVTHKNSWCPNTLIKQGAKLVATWEELPVELRLTLKPKAADESNTNHTASLFEDDMLGAQERKIPSTLKSDEAMQLDEIIERLEQELCSSETFARHV